MRQMVVLELYAGGPGSGCNPSAGTCGRKSTGREKPLSDRAKRAIATYVPVTAERRQFATSFQSRLAQLVGGQVTANNQPFDVMVGKHGVEVKVFLDQKNDKVTMHPDSLARKVGAARKLKVKAHTVVFDARGDQPQIYYRKGVGSFRLGSMEPMDEQSLKGRFK